VEKKLYFSLISHRYLMILEMSFSPDRIQSLRKVSWAISDETWIGTIRSRWISWKISLLIPGRASSMMLCLREARLTL